LAKRFASYAFRVSSLPFLLFSWGDAASRMALPPPLPPQSSTSPTPLLYQGRVRGPPVSASIYVTDLPEDCTEARLFELFNAAGPVASIRVCCDPATSRRLGSAYVNFHSPADAARAIDKLNYSVINGHAISIRYSASPSVQKIASARLLHRSCIALCCTAHVLHCAAPLMYCTVLHRSYAALCCTAPGGRTLIQICALALALAAE
jgi:hypothetical protein